LSEIYFHPAREATERLAATMPGWRHADELAALTSPRLRRALELAGVERTSFTQLMGGTAS
jgi:hypothetical protein